MSQFVRLDEVAIDTSVQVRDGLDPKTVAQYVDDWDLLPPLIVYRLPDGRLLLADGFHRVAAARELGLGQVPADLYEGDETQARDHAVRANMVSGKHLTKEERHRAIWETHLRHAKKLSQEEIAWLSGASQSTVSRVFAIKDVTADLPNLTNIGKAPAASGRGTRAKQAIKDDHLEAMRPAPKDDRPALAQVTARKELSPRETRAIAEEIARVETPAERKEALLAGEAEPLVSKNGQPAMLPETVKRIMCAPDPASDDYLAYKDVTARLCALVVIGPQRLLRGAPPDQLRDIADSELTIPRYIAFFEAVRAEARARLSVPMSVVHSVGR